MIATASQFLPMYDKEVLVAKMSLAVPQGRRAEALVYGKQVVTEFPDWLDGHIAYAMAYFWNADFSSSINVLNNANSIAEFNKAHRLLAVMYYLDENYPSSVRSLERALEMDPDAILDVSAVSASALSMLELGRRDDGMALLQKYAAVDPLAEAKPDYINAKERFDPKPRLRGGIVTSAVTNGPSAPTITKPIIDPDEARTRNEVEYVFEKNRRAIFALYNRALRRDPTLEGRVVVEIGIQANGDVSSCEIESSRFTDVDFFNKLCERITRFEFVPLSGAEPTIMTKSIDFISGN